MIETKTEWGTNPDRYRLLLVRTRDGEARVTRTSLLVLEEQRSSKRKSSVRRAEGAEQDDGGVTEGIVRAE